MLLALATLIAVSFGALGAFFALRTGSSEAVQGLFPLLFVLLFLSSMNLPRNLIETDWFRTVATLNPVSYLIEGIRSLIITGWDAQALLLGFGIAATMGLSRSRRHSWALRTEVDEDMRPVLVCCSRRRLARRAQRLHDPVTPAPGADLPALLLHRFRGRALARDNIPGFNFPPGYTAFQFVFVLLQSAAFGGVFTGFGVARDFEFGIRAAPHAGGAAAQRDHRRLRNRRRRAVVADGDAAHDRRSPGLE